MSRLWDDSPVPKHRAAPVTLGAEGAVAPSLVWKVCAVLPLVLLCVLMSVKVADGFGKNDSKGSSQTQEPDVIPSDDPFTPSPTEPPSATQSEKEREIMSGAPKPSELPNEAIPSETLIPDSGFEIPPGDIDQTATPVPTKKPTKKPTQTPSPTPTPDEAREQCIESGVNVLNVAALAACIADRMDPNG